LRVPIFTAALFVLAVSPAAWAQDSTAAYAGDEASPENAGRVAQALALLKPAVILSDVPRHIEDFAPAGALVAPGAPVIACEGEPVDRTTYLHEVADLGKAVWEVDDLGPFFTAIRQTQACLSESVEAGDLARVAFVEGAMAFELGQPDDATAAFRQVFAMDPTFAWDGQFGPGAKQSFDAMGAEVANGARVDLTILTAPGDRVLVDGHPYETATLLVSPGSHLVQVGQEGGLRSVLVDTIGRDATVVLDADALNAALAAGEGEALVTALFVALGEDAPDHLLWIGDGERIWGWDAGGAQLTEVPLTAAAQASLDPPVDGGKKRPGPATPVLIAVGAGLVAGGTVLSMATRTDLADFDASVQSGEIHPFPAPDAADPESYPLYQEWQGKVNRLGVGYALIAAGGVSLLASIPVGLLTARTVEPRIAFGATLLASGQSDGADGFVFTVSWR
jgi:hypothetical protein